MINTQSTPKIIYNQILVSSLNDQLNQQFSPSFRPHPHPPNHHSKRKIQPAHPHSLHQSLKDRMAQLEGMCRGYDVAQQNAQLQAQNQWVYNEYFLSNSDKEFFERREMGEILSFLDVQKNDISYQKFKGIKRALPKPKLFQKDFINQEKYSLEECRASKRRKIFNKVNIPSSQRHLFSIDSKYTSPLQTGDNVWAFHPVCQHIHSGSVLAQYKEDIYMIKFNKVELGTYKMSDYTISSVFLEGQKKMPIFKSFSQISSINSSIDMGNLAIYLHFLEYKSQLMKKIQEYHDLATMARDRGEILSQAKLQEYGWIGSQISLINISLKYMMLYFPLTTKKEAYRSEKVTKLPSLYPNPLYTSINSGTTLSEESEEKKEQRKNSIKPVKNPDEWINKSKYMRAEDKEIEEIIKSSVGILWGMYEQELDEKYMNKLYELIGEKYPSYFGEIYRSIKRILEKSH